MQEFYANCQQAGFDEIPLISTGFSLDLPILRIPDGGFILLYSHYSESFCQHINYFRFPQGGRT